jgi:spermidine synthase
VDVQVGDGFLHIAESENEYDVIMVDSTEPVGPAVNLFTKGFYAGISKALKEDGIFVAQSDNPWFKADLIRNVQHDVKGIFPITNLYVANIPTIQVVYGHLQSVRKNTTRLKWRMSVSMKLKQNIIQKNFIKQLLYYLNLFKI